MVSVDVEYRVYLLTNLATLVMTLDFALFLSQRPHGPTCCSWWWTTSGPSWAAMEKATWSLPTLTSWPPRASASIGPMCRSVWAVIADWFWCHYWTDQGLFLTWLSRVVVVTVCLIAFFRLNAWGLPNVWWEGRKCTFCRTNVSL